MHTPEYKVSVDMLLTETRELKRYYPINISLQFPYNTDGNISQNSKQGHFSDFCEPTDLI